LSLPVIGYSAWIFFDGAVRALRQRTLDMMVLVAVAIGAGTDVAIETADVVLMHSDPLDVPTALAIGRGTLRKMRQNLGWAVGYNAIALPIAAGVFEPAFGLVLRPEIAAISMSGSSLIVAVNARMLRRLRLPGSGQTHRPMDGDS
jgi:P-type Cu2+ transporter